MGARAPAFLGWMLCACAAGGPAGLPADAGARDAAAADAASPLPAGRRSLWLAPGSVADLMELFRDDAPWTTVAARTDVVVLDAPWVAAAAGGDLATVASWAARRHVLLGVQGGVCGGSPGGLLVAALGALRAQGGEVRLLVVDHPYSTCGVSRPETVALIRAALRDTAGLAPGAVAGVAETLSITTTPGDIDELAASWSPAFVHLDVLHDSTSWPVRLFAVERALAARGVPLGVAYRGDDDAATGEQWIDGAWGQILTYEGQTGGAPEHVVFGPGGGKPGHALPDDEPLTLTGFMRGYLRPRGTISLSLSGRRLSGRLLGAGGEALAQAGVTAAVVPFEGQGTPFEYSFDGVVPAGAVKATVGIRINDEECQCGGPLDVSIYGAAYREGQNGPNLLKNADFSLGDWGGGGDPGVAMLVQSDISVGKMLRIFSGGTPDIWRNSPEIVPVTPGVRYHFSVRARIAPISVDAGVLTIIFQNDLGEIQRHSMPFSPVAATFPAVTAAGGEYTVALPESTLQRSVTVTFAGDDDHFPAVRAVNVP